MGSTILSFLMRFQRSEKKLTSARRLFTDKREGDRLEKRKKMTRAHPSQVDSIR